MRYGKKKSNLRGLCTASKKGFWEKSYFLTKFLVVQNNQEKKTMTSKIFYYVHIASLFLQYLSYLKKKHIQCLFLSLDFIINYFLILII